MFLGVVPTSLLQWHLGCSATRRGHRHVHQHSAWRLKHAPAHTTLSTVSGSHTTRAAVSLRPQERSPGHEPTHQQPGAACHPLQSPQHQFLHSQSSSCSLACGHRDTSTCRTIVNLQMAPAHKAVGSYKLAQLMSGRDVADMQNSTR